MKINTGTNAIEVMFCYRDPAGQERFNQITRAYFRGAQAVIFVFDVTSQQSFEHVRNWIIKVQDELGE